MFSLSFFLLLVLSPGLVHQSGDKTPERLYEMIKSDWKAPHDFDDWSKEEFIACAKACLRTTNNFNYWLDICLHFSKDTYLKGLSFAFVIELARDGQLLQFTNYGMIDKWTVGEDFLIFKAYVSSGAEVAQFAVHSSKMFNKFVKTNPRGVYEILTPEDKQVVQCNLHVFKLLYPNIEYFDFVAKNYQEMSRSQILMVCLSFPGFPRRTAVNTAIDFLYYVLNVTYTEKIPKAMKTLFFSLLKRMGRSVMVDLDLNAREVQLLHGVIGGEIFKAIGHSNKKRYLRCLLDSPSYSSMEHEKALKDSIEAWDLFYFDGINEQWDIHAADFILPDDEDMTVRTEKLNWHTLWMLHHAKVILPEMQEEDYDIQLISDTYCFFVQFQNCYEKLQFFEMLNVGNFRVKGKLKKKVVASEGSLQSFIDANWHGFDKILQVLCCIFSNKSEITLTCLNKALESRDFLKAKFLGHHLLKVFPSTLSIVIEIFMKHPVILEELLNAHVFNSDLVYKAAIDTDTLPLIRGKFVH